MSESTSEVSLAKLIEEIDQHVPRIKSRATQTSTNGSQPSGNTAMLELSGTVLPIVRDLISYVALLESAVVRNSEETSDRIEQIEAGIVSIASEQVSDGTQFEPEDADKFVEFIQATKIMLEAMRDSNVPTENKKQFEKMIAAADELLAIVEDCTLDDEEEGQPDEQAKGDSL